MSYSIKGTTISLTRGDSFAAIITIKKPNGDEYRPSEGDKITFSAKKRITDTNVIITKNIPIDTMKLILEPNDTKGLEFGKYVYDIQLETSDGFVDTFITKSELNVMEEVN